MLHSTRRALVNREEVGNIFHRDEALEGFIKALQIRDMLIEGFSGGLGVFEEMPQ